MGVSLESDDRWSTPPRLYRLWAGILLAPLAWAAHLNVAYAMATVVCTPAVSWPFYIVSALMFAAALAGGWIAWSVRRHTADEPEDAPTSRARGRFMTLAGILLSIMFALTIVAQTIPMLLLPPCEF